MAWTPILQTKKEWKPILPTGYSPTPKVQGLLNEAKVAQEEAKKANSFGGLLKKTITGLPQATGKVASAVTKAVVKPAVNALLVRPAIRTGQVLGTPIAKALGATPEGIARAQNTTTTVNTGLLGKYNVKPATSQRQVAGEGLEAASYLYTPAKAAQSAMPFLKGVSVPARQAVSNIVRGGLGGYAADVGYGLQDETKTVKQVLKPGLGTVLGAGIPAVVAGAQAVKEGRKLYQSMTPAQRQAGFAKFVPDGDDVPLPKEFPKELRNLDEIDTEIYNLKKVKPEEGGYQSGARIKLKVNLEKSLGEKGRGAELYFDGIPTKQDVIDYVKKEQQRLGIKTPSKPLQRIGVADTHTSYTPRMRALIKEAQEKGETFPFTKFTPEEQQIADRAFRGEMETFIKGGDSQFFGRNKTVEPSTTPKTAPQQAVRAQMDDLLNQKIKAQQKLDKLYRENPTLDAKGTRQAMKLKSDITEIDNYRASLKKPLLAKENQLRSEDFGAGQPSDIKGSRRYEATKSKGFDAYFDANYPKPIAQADYLTQEARKYKSAEEFVNSKIGKKQPVFHGTTEIIEGDFKYPLYLTKDKTYAEHYATNKSASSITTYAKKGGGEKVYEFYPKDPKRVLDIRKPEHADIIRDYWQESVSGQQVPTKTGLPDWTEGESLAQFLEEKKLPFDSVLVDEGGIIDPFTNKIKHRGVGFVAINKDSLLTKSQLTDLWERATKKEGILLKARQMTRSKEIPSLEQVAREQIGEPLLQPQPKLQVKAPLLQKVKPLASEISEGEVRSVEKSAEESLARANQGGNVGMPSLPKIISQSQTPVSKKVGALDYLRTPDRVLKKIGLSKNADEIRVQYDKYLDELPKNIDKITAWSKRVPKESGERIFKYLDGEVIDLQPEERQVATDIKAWLEDWADRLKLPKDNRIANYITHLFDDQLIKKEFDEDLAKIIADKVPGSVYDPFLLKRLGAMGYKEDVWAALDAYVKRATRKVHMDVALGNLEDVAGSLEQSQWDYVKKYADRLNLRPTEWDTKFDNSLKQVIGYRFGQRPVANLSRTLRQVTFRGMLGGNISSALRNLSQGVNTYSKLGEKYTATGYMKLVTKGTRELREQGILRDNFIQDRTLSATKKFMERLDKGLFAFFDMAEKINRGAAYYGAKSKALAQGLDESQAIEFAKKIVRDTQFLYSNVDTPLLMQGDIAKVLMQFMSYPVKQTEFLVEMAKNKEFAGMLRYAIGGLAFVYTAGKLMNMEPKELIPWSDYFLGDRKFGVPPSLKFPVEVVKAGLNTPDDYGQPRSLEDKARDIGKTLTGVIPAGTQLKKTFEGIKAYNQGASVTPSGRVRYPIEQDLKTQLKTGVFGQYSTKRARQYFDDKETSLSEKQSLEVLGSQNPQETFEQIKKEQAEAKVKEAQKAEFKVNVYQRVQDLVNQGSTEEAKKIVNELSDEDYETYKSIRASERSKRTTEMRTLLERNPQDAVKYLRSQDPDEQQRLLKLMTDEEYAIYSEAKGDIITQ